MVQGEYPQTSADEYLRPDSSAVDKIIKAPYPGGYPLLQFKNQYFPLAEMGLSTFYYYNDWFEAALMVGLQGLSRSSVACPEIYYNLGHYFFELSDYESAAYCYERFLITNRDRLAAERLKMIRSGLIRIWHDS